MRLGSTDGNFNIASRLNAVNVARDDVQRVRRSHQRPEPKRDVGDGIIERKIADVPALESGGNPFDLRFNARDVGRREHATVHDVSAMDGRRIDLRQDDARPIVRLRDRHGWPQHASGMQLNRRSCSDIPRCNLADRGRRWRARSRLRRFDRRARLGTRC